MAANVSNDGFFRLVRIYTSAEPYPEDVYKLSYVREYKLPLNNFLKFDCHFFQPQFRYYCFVFVALARTNGAVAVSSRPFCKPTAEQQLMMDSNDGIAGGFNSDAVAIDFSFQNNRQGSVDDEQNEIERLLEPAGPSYVYRTAKEAVNVRDQISEAALYYKRENDIVDANGNSDTADVPDLQTLACKCNEWHNIRANDTSVIIITVDILSCRRRFTPNDRDNGAIGAAKKINDRRLINMQRRSESRKSVCVLSFVPQTRFSVEVMEVRRKMRPTNHIYSSMSEVVGSRSLIVRDGQLSIDPQLDIRNKSVRHSLKSSFLRFESVANMTITIVVNKIAPSSDGVAYRQPFIYSLTVIHYTSISLLLLIAIALIALICIAIFGRPRRTKVRITTPSEANQTSLSCLDQSTASAFSFADNNSLEMDYYDIQLPFARASLDSTKNDDSSDDNVDENAKQPAHSTPNHSPSHEDTTNQ